MFNAAGHLHAVAGVEKQVQHESYAKQARARPCAQRDINERGWPGVQRVETDAAPQRIVDRIRKQVVEVDHEAAEQAQVALPPALAPEQRDERGGNEEVKRDVKDVPDSGSGKLCRLVEAQLPAVHLAAETPDRTVQRAIALRRLRKDLLRAIAYKTQALR